MALLSPRRKSRSLLGYEATLGKRRRLARQFRPRVEALEDRTVPTSVTIAGGGSSSWTIEDVLVTSNGLPTGGSCTDGPAGSGASIDDASLAVQSDAFDEAGTLWINNARVGGILTQNGNTVTFAAQSLFGLNTSLQYYIASGSATARILLTLQNTGGSTITVPVDYLTNSGADGGTVYKGTSSGDTGFTTADRWVVSDEAGDGGGDPANTTVIAGPGSPAVTPSSVSTTVFDCAGTEGVRATFNLTVGAGQTRSLLFFQQLNPTTTAALANAPLFFNTNPPQGGDLLAGLTSAQLAQVANWNFGPAACPNNVYVDDNFPNPVPGQDPDGAGPATNFGFDAFATIQQGVNAVCDSGNVFVAAGTYNEQVTVNKTVQLLGAQAGVDARTGRPGANESIITHTLGPVNILANNVTVDGFVIQGANTDPGSNIAALGSGIRTGVANSGYQIRNNVIQNNIIGLYLNSGGAAASVVRQNYFLNNNLPGAAGGSAIYSDQGVANVVIDSNRFTGSTNTSITFAGAAGSQSNLSVSNNQIVNDSTVFVVNASNVTISGNTITGSALHGIQLDGGNSGVTVSGNTISNSNPDGWSAIRISNNSGFGPNSGITVSGNMLTNNFFGIRATSGSYTGTLSVSDNTITNGNTALDLAGFSTLNLTRLTSTGNVSGGSITNVATVNFTTTDAGETLRVSAASFEATNVQPISYSGVSNLNVNAAGGNDTFFVSPSQGTTITVNGGSPSFGQPGVPPGGDTLNFDPLGNSFIIVGKTIFTNGGSPSPFLGVTFIDIENLPIMPLGTSTLRFDFNNNSPVSPTQAGYTGVLPTKLYGGGPTGSDFGWVTAPQGGFDRGAPANLTSSFAALLRDGHYGGVGAGARTFRADVTNGFYLVSVKMGDATFARDLMRVTNADNGQVILDNVTTAAGQFAARTFVIGVTDGSLDLRFSDLGGDPYWVVNGIEVRPAVLLTEGFAPQGPFTADGTTQDTFTAVGATPNALVTVATTLGTITSPDLDANIAGVQRLADASGNVTITIRRPAAAGTAFVSFEEVTGAKTGCGVVMYVLQAFRRFDFNGPSNDTAAGFIGVRGSNTYSPQTGYGWNVAVPEFERTGDGISSTPAALYRDGHYGNVGVAGARTFRVQVNPGLYTLTAYFGDRSFARDFIRIRAEGGADNVVPNTAANQFVTVTFTGMDVNADGILDVTVTDFGGDPYWVINGLDVMEGGSPGGGGGAARPSFASSATRTAAVVNSLFAGTDAGVVRGLSAPATTTAALPSGAVDDKQDRQSVAITAEPAPARTQNGDIVLFAARNRPRAEEVDALFRLLGEV